MSRKILLAPLLAASAMVVSISPAYASTTDRAREAIAAAEAKVHTAETLGASVEMPRAAADARASLNMAKEEFMSGHKDQAIDEAIHAQRLADTAIGVMRNHREEAVAEARHERNEAVANARDEAAAAHAQAADAQQQAAEANARAELAQQQAAASAAEASAARTALTVVQTPPVPAPAATVETVTTTTHRATTRHHVARRVAHKRAAVAHHAHHAAPSRATTTTTTRTTIRPAVQ